MRRSRSTEPTATRPTVVLIGPESAGKSTLAAALTHVRSRAQNVAGSTLAVERYDADDRIYLDTPGVVHGIDTTSGRLGLELLDPPTDGSDATDGEDVADGEDVTDGGKPSDRDAVDADTVVLVVVRATHLDDELDHLLPVVRGRRGVVAVTGWDRVEDTLAARRAVDALAAAIGVPFVAMDARAPGPALDDLRVALDEPGTFTRGPVLVRAGWRIEPPPTLLEHPRLGPPVGLALLLTPAVAAVWTAIVLAGWVEPYVEGFAAPVAVWSDGLVWPLDEVVAGDYGLVTMGPLLLVWALPVVVVLALLLGVWRSSGLLDRLTTAVHPWVRPFGLTGRDLTRIVAGHGCNVPAVISTRSCSGCTRDATVGAIAFGAACSYQLAATLGVLTAAQAPGLLAPYLLALLGGALAHARLLARASGVDPAALDLHLLRGRAFLSRPTWSETWHEARSTLSHVTLRALPIFGAITVVASLLAAVGAVDVAARALGPVLAVLRLPAEAALPVALASVRKDGLLLLAEPSTVAQLDGPQLVAALLLAGALVPCLVTAATIWRERGTRIAGRLLVRQALGALLLAGAVSWLGWIWLQVWS